MQCPLVYLFGVLFSGVTLDPFTAEFFQQANGQSNRDWNITALTNAIHLGLDCNNAHVQPNGKYHYHGTPTALLEALDTNRIIKPFTLLQNALAMPQSKRFYR